ncbi:MAG: hypothetical protein MK185_05540 [Saccharospirillaceae bacterium]|nr:hypothetical protein [Saccharospirillaceae bacterium]
MKNPIAAFLLFASFYACAETQYGLAVGTGSQNSRSIAVPIRLGESNRIEASFTIIDFDRKTSEREKPDNSKDRDTDLSVAVAYHRLLHGIAGEIVPYWGGGARLYYGEDDSVSRSESYDGNGIYSSKSSTSTRGYGVNFILGAEYPISQQLSVSGEVGLEYSNVREIKKYRGSNTRPNASPSEPTTDDSKRANIRNYSMLIVRFMF